MDPLRLLAGLDTSRLSRIYRARELFSRESVEAPLAVRLDGVGWGRRLRGSFKRPRDARVHRAEARAALHAALELGCDAAYVTSDEVTLFWISRSPPYSGRVEKLVSISSGLLSSRVSLALGVPLHYDARVVKLSGPQDAALYVALRARVGLNNYVSSLYHMLGLGSRGYTPPLGEMIEALRARGLGPERLPPWALYGSCIVQLEAERRTPEGAATRRRWAVATGFWWCFGLPPSGEAGAV